MWVCCTHLAARAGDSDPAQAGEDNVDRRLAPAAPLDAELVLL